ncbi:hypothetical protein Pcatena_04320 [Parolsenella catena]|uniref:Uncharacterized protein n=1 Tax=Parolsenella catena TaxID=2003188 RepID=A0A3G9KAE1_9ACTN|nr:hypothetical protein [Parolsenella catena]BBH49845.1 hypothetical protein Pcatena_04320 [Parolsenella catena]
MAVVVQLDGTMSAEVARFLREGHSTLGVRRMLEACPRLREHVEADRDVLMSREADEHATRHGKPWTRADYNRVAADSRDGLPMWRTAKALRRTVEDVRRARATLCGSQPLAGGEGRG